MDVRYRRYPGKAGPRGGAVPRSLGPLAVALAVVLAAGCGGGDSLTGPTDPRDVVFAPELGIDIRTFTETDSGLFFKDLEEGAGDAVVPGTTVVVSTTGWLPNGREFQAPVTLDPFVVGDGTLIPGFEEGVVGMKEGGVRMLVLPPALAYGSVGRPGIPPNSVLVFRVELEEVELFR